MCWRDLGLREHVNDVCDVCCATQLRGMYCTLAHVQHVYHIHLRWLAFLLIILVIVDFYSSMCNIVPTSLFSHEHMPLRVLLLPFLSLIITRNWTGSVYSVLCESMLFYSCENTLHEVVFHLLLPFSPAAWSGKHCWTESTSCLWQWTGHGYQHCRLHKRCVFEVTLGGGAYKGYSLYAL